MPRSPATRERVRYLAQFRLPLPPRIAELAEAVGAATRRLNPRPRRDSSKASCVRAIATISTRPRGRPKIHSRTFFAQFSERVTIARFYSTAMTVLLRRRRRAGNAQRHGLRRAGRTIDFPHSYVVPGRATPTPGWRCGSTGTAGRGSIRRPPSDAAPRSELTGVLAVMRDFIEALGQRWSHHVIGYDLRQQLGLWDQLLDAYSRVIPHRGPVGRVLASPRKTLLGMLAIAQDLGIGVLSALDAPRRPAEERRARPRRGGARALTRQPPSTDRSSGCSPRLAACLDPRAPRNARPRRVRSKL